jgi:glycopeptide antibiotics resistance protein
MQTAAEATPTTLQPARAARRRVRRSPAFAFFCAYALFVVYGTLLPFQFIGDRQLLAAKRAWINWNPMVLVTGEPTPITDLVMNVAFFVPLGFIAFHAQRRRSTTSAVLRAAVAGLVLTTTVEALQFFTPTRNPATSDVLTNTLGATLGALLAAYFRLRLETKLRRGATLWRARQPLLPILIGHVFLVMVAALVPFDLAPGISYLKRAVRAAQLDPRGLPLDWADLVQTAVPYAVLAGLGVYVLSRLRAGRSLARLLGCTAAAAVLALGLELLQLLVRSRVASTRDVLVAIAGAAVGGLVALVLGTGARARHGWTLVGLAYALTLALQALAPFRFDLDWQAMRARLTYTALIPYSSYYFKANVAAVADFLEGLLAYLPLAFVLSQTRARSGASQVRSGITVVGWCALYALGLEFLQLGLPRRHPEVSDVLTAALGAGLGAYAWRWFAALGTALADPRLANEAAAVAPASDALATMLEPHTVPADPAPIAPSAS